MWKIIAVVSLVLTATLFVTDALLERELVRRTGYGTLSLQTVASRSEGEKILNAWDSRESTLAETGLAIDFAFMFLGYGLLLFSIGRLLDSNLLSFLAFLPVVFDSAENILHLIAVSGDRAGIFAVSRPVSLLKFVLLGLYLAVLAVTVVLKVVRALRKHAR